MSSPGEAVGRVTIVFGRPESARRARPRSRARPRGRLRERVRGAPTSTETGARSSPSRRRARSDRTARVGSASSGSTPTAWSTGGARVALGERRRRRGGWLRVRRRRRRALGCGRPDRARRGDWLVGADAAGVPRRPLRLRERRRERHARGRRLRPARVSRWPLGRHARTAQRRARRFRVPDPLRREPPYIDGPVDGADRLVMGSRTARRPRRRGASTRSPRGGLTSRPLTL